MLIRKLWDAQTRTKIATPITGMVLLLSKTFIQTFVKRW